MYSSILHNNYFIFSILFSLFFYLKSISSKSLFLTSLFYFPGTVLHELMHFIIGLVLYAKPVSFSLFPKKNGGNYTLGEVKFSNLNFFNTLPVALAPLLMLGILYYVDLKFFSYFKYSFFTMLGFVYLNFVFASSAIPSVTDIKVGFSNWVGVLFWLVIIGVSAGYFYYGGFEWIDNLKVFVKK